MYLAKEPSTNPAHKAMSLNKNSIYSFWIMLFFCGVIPVSAFSQTDLDPIIEPLLKRYRITPLQTLNARNEALYEAGARLFSDNILSGNRNISCQDCHTPRNGTSDGLALSLGQGKNLDFGQSKRQLKGAVLRRNSSALFNLGQAAATHMFWDSRVKYQYWGDPGYVTPEPRLNGSQPAAKDIVENLKRPVDVQALFPPLARDEMRGYKGENELANADTNEEVWRRLVVRIRRERPQILSLIEQAYQLDSPYEVNIGHVGGAIGEFISHRFQATDTPFDRYLNGNKGALTAEQKKGLMIFLERGRCVFCHNGPLLSNNVVMSTGVPPLAAVGQELDKGRGSVTADKNDNFLFRTPPLRNVVFTAPYMHDGIFITLAEVIEHYDNVYQSLDSFQADPKLFTPYTSKIKQEKNNAILSSIADQISPLIQSPLNLSNEEKSALLEFLSSGLRDDSFLQEL